MFDYVINSIQRDYSEYHHWAKIRYAKIEVLTVAPLCHHIMLKMMCVCKVRYSKRF